MIPLYKNYSCVYIAILFFIIMLFKRENKKLHHP